MTFLVATAASACCTNDAELGTEFLARSSNVSMKKYTSKDVGLEGWGSTPVAFVDPGPDEANFGKDPKGRHRASIEWVFSHT